MRRFVMSYTQLVAQLNSSRQKHFNDCQQKLNNVYTHEYLLQQLINSKGTGTERPVEIDINNLHSTSHVHDNSFSTINSNTNTDLTLATANAVNTINAHKFNTYHPSSRLHMLPSPTPSAKLFSEISYSKNINNNNNNQEVQVNSNNYYSTSPMGLYSTRKNKSDDNLSRRLNQNNFTMNDDISKQNPKQTSGK
jgi:hypothetical protein